MVPQTEEYVGVTGSHIGRLDCSLDQQALLVFFSMIFFLS